MKGLPPYLICAASAALLGAGHSNAVAADADRCQARLELRLTPDVPNPRAPAFLSALTADPLYELKWIDGTDSTAVLELEGPATDYHCENEIGRISRDAHVLDLKVLQADSH